MTQAPDFVLTKPDVYKTCRIQLTSPILHIGSAVSKLNPFECVQTGRRVYLPDQNALARALKERGRLDDFIQRVEDRGDITSLLEDTFGDRWQTALTSEGDRLFPEHLISAKWTGEKITELRPMIRNGLGQLYIPGSSLKGAIRTAIAYYLLKHAERFNVPQQNQISAIESRLRKSMGELRHRAKFTDDSLFMNRLFADFDLIYQGKPVSAREGPNTDFMRAVHVTDSDPLIEQEIVNKRGQKGAINQAITTEVIVSSHFPDWKAKYRASIYTEMVRLAQTQFTITLDETMLSWFRHSQRMTLPFQTIEDLLKICQEFAQDQWDHEHYYWQEVKNNPNAQGKNLDFSDIRTLYEPEQCPFSLRVGWASGMAGTTVNLLLDDNLRMEIRDTCGLKAPGFEAPKSRRTVVGSSGAIKFVPGWVKFKVV
ncbi:type III-A CRISPR-associated RAMP protein Csm5 [Leptolyngbya sp. 'hensonii']|uniref:type III-A CRISPR-associated RAMP protein Csm5 n=1 Tax=Leptolyngbya sp. 'hensonii' TaxID=1922337 RepID=UPI0009500724|nr:type III-A CRISPR-associated RAMP protein Csm5 [Leptolyngbya sp. 'hensonii']OLP19171.1 type III-A CRISPR-associated RAMP protein Csm5 [Leptolyngbya sp. 'hensonii']